jgi:hypothetical protein
MTIWMNETNVVLQEMQQSKIAMSMEISRHVDKVKKTQHDRNHLKDSEAIQWEVRTVWTQLSMYMTQIKSI